MNYLNTIYYMQKEIALLSSINQILSWDEETKLPAAAIESRCEQSKLVKRMIHRTFLSPQLWYAVNSVTAITNKDKLVIPKLKEEIIKQRKVSHAFVEEMTQQEIISRNDWMKAKELKDATIFLPALKKMIKLKRKYALLINPGIDPYSTLLQENEKNITSQKLDSLIIPLKKELLALKKHGHTSPLISLNIIPSIHKKLLKKIIFSMGIERKKIVLGVSTYPFSLSVSKNDVRITMRDNKTLNVLFDVMHEAGHALYDLNLPNEYNNTVLFAGASTGLHESQSTFWEIFIGKNPLFWKKYFSIYKAALEKPISLEKFLEHLYYMGNPLKRMDANLLDYCLHIILRYEIERDLIAGKIELSDLSSIWNNKMKEYLGIIPKDDSEGLLQDVHWADGDFGYFPTYLIGLMYAAQIFETMEKTIPDFNKQITDHSFGLIKDWLVTNIHSYGNILSAEQIIKKATGSGLSYRALISYLKKTLI